MPILDLRKIVKKYRMGNDIITAIDQVSLTVEEGEFIAIVGTSGCGKTTLMNISAGLEQPTKGEVFFRDIVLNKLNEKKMVFFRRRYMGFVFQAYNLIPTLTALENVALPLMFAGINRKERNGRAMELLEIMGLKERWKHKPMEMSGGQQQRVSIARALANRPQIIFADEPTGNLDSRTTGEVLSQIKFVAKRDCQTLVMVTHDLNVASFADRLIYLADGRLFRDGDNSG
ncbi:MAG: putative ABC transporter ATP-binding protein [Syntrophomonadaceae bacterium]|nr:putative ABC transporter ATP-binding protein [Bacillota bacterium]